MAFAVMVSHSTKDKAIAEAVCQRLEAAGFPCWIAPRDIAPGVEWTAAIMEGIAACRLMVLVFSEGANASKHVAREVLYAGDSHIPVLPFRVQETVPSGGIAYYLLGLQWLDAWQGPLEPHLETLLARVRRMLPDLAVGADEPEICFECTHCKQAMVIEAKAEGMQVDCVECGRSVTVPTAPWRETLRAAAAVRPPPAAVIDAMTNRLNPVLGPIARHLVQNAAAQATTEPELIRKLAEAIADKRDREAFLRSCGVEAEGAAMPSTAAVAPSGHAPETAPASFPRETIDALKDGLAHHLGPMAGFLVDQAVRESRTFDELCNLLTAKIASPRDRAAWAKSIQRLK